MLTSTATIPLSNIGLTIRAGLRGGVCRWWLVPVQHLWHELPTIDPTTGLLTAEPVLITGKTWLGPALTTDKETGYTERMVRTAAGIAWEHTLEGFIPGLSSNDHINAELLPYHRYMVAMQPRNTNILMFLGLPPVGLRVTSLQFETGQGRAATIGTSITLTATTAYRAYLLPTGQETALPTYTPGAICLGYGLTQSYFYVATGNEGTTITIPGLHNAVILGISRSGMKDLSITTGTLLYDYHVAYTSDPDADPPTGIFTVAADYPISAGETFWILYRS